MVPAKILAIKLRSLGDTVILTASLNELVQAFPQAEIHVAVTREWAPLLDHFAGVQRVWGIDRGFSKMKRAQDWIQAACQLRKERYDYVVNFHASSSSALLALSTGAAVRSIHFHGHRDKNRFSTVKVPGRGTLKPIIERDMDAIRALGVHVPAGRSPKVHLQSSEIQDAQVYLEKLGLKKPVLAMGLGASRPTKKWPMDRFAALAIEWSRKKEGGVLALAGPDEEHLAQGFLKGVDDLLVASFSNIPDRSLIRNRIKSIHHLPLRKLAAVLNQVSVWVGNDSGPKHLAVAVDTPTVTLFGPEDPFEWHPYLEKSHPYLFVRDLPCRRDADPGMPPWCGLQECRVEDHKCMRMIGVDFVLDQCQQMVKSRV